MSILGFGLVITRGERWMTVVIGALLARVDEYPCQYQVITMPLAGVFIYATVLGYR